MNARNALRNSSLYTVSAIITGLLLHATDASAYWEEVTAAACAPVTGSSLVFSSNGSVGGTGTMVCPLQDEWDHPGPANGTDVYLRDDSSSANISAQACATVIGPTGEYCGTPATTTGTGWKIIHPNPGVFWTVSGFYNLRVTLPANSGNSRLTGFVAKY